MNFAFSCFNITLYHKSSKIYLAISSVFVWHFSEILFFIDLNDIETFTACQNVAKINTQTLPCFLSRNWIILDIDNYFEVTLKI